MSFQAVTWAIEQKAGGPSAKATLWSIANYANDKWCAWPSQDTICGESEQSPDTVQRRLPDLVARNLIRRIPLRFAGRKTVDFFILAPSPYFTAELPEIEPLLPRGCSIYVPEYVPESPDSSQSDPPDAAASCGNVLDPTLPQTLPQPAENATALLRQQEPVTEPGNLEGGGGSARAREPLVTVEATQLAEQLATICGFPDPKDWPPGWCGAPMAVQAMLTHGWQPAIMLATARSIMGRKRDGPPETVNYFRKPFARAHAQDTTPFPVVAGGSSDAKPAARSDITSAIDRHIERFEREERAQDGSGAVRQAPPRLLSNG